MTVTLYTGPLEAFPRHTVFDALVVSGAAARVLATDDAGEHFGFQLDAAAAEAHHVAGPDRVAIVGLRTPSAATLAALAAHSTASAARNTRRLQVAAALRARAVQHQTAADAATGAAKFTQQTLVYLCRLQAGDLMEDLEV